MFFFASVVILLIALVYFGVLGGVDRYFRKVVNLNENKIRSPLGFCRGLL
jgi:uncharacterized membrane protein